MAETFYTEIEEALSAIPQTQVYFIYPETETDPGMPVITYSIVGNSPERSGDNAVYVDKLSAKIDVWHNTPEKVDDTGDKIQEAMESIAYVKDNRTGVYKDEEYFRETLYFNKII